MIAIDKVNVGASGWTEQDGIAGGASGSRVGRGIVLAEIGFSLDDPGGKQLSALAAHQDFAQ